MSIKAWGAWLRHRPVAIINIVGILVIIIGGGAYVVYQAFRPLDVLSKWDISISAVKEYRVIDGERLAVFHPGDSLIFYSQSVKTEPATGITVRTIVCEATDEQPAREIQLDSLPANRQPGEVKPRENAITVPDVSQFKKLPRTCYLSIDITYTNVALWRSAAEHSQSEDFLVEEPVLDPIKIQAQIDELNQRITDVKNKAE